MITKLRYPKTIKKIYFWKTSTSEWKEWSGELSYELVNFSYEHKLCLAFVY